MSELSEFCDFCRHDTYLPCKDAEKAERCQLAGQAAMDYDCAEAACQVLFEQWWEVPIAERKLWRSKMIKALTAAKKIEARGFQPGLASILQTAIDNGGQEFVASVLRNAGVQWPDRKQEPQEP